jgi:sugar phosphate isomerase/epimerase
MNDPARPLADELATFARLGFDFVDLTLEPPGAWPFEGGRVRELLDAHGLAAVGHTAWFLPLVSPFPELERASRDLFVRACETFAEAGVRLVNVHPTARQVDPAEAVARNAAALGELVEAATAVGVELMVENVLDPFGTPDGLAPLFEAAPAARFHLDVGHANLDGGGRLAPLLEAFGDRLAHVHLSDNIGGEDLHLPLGAGRIDWPAAARALRGAGYDGTVTLEVFSRSREHVETSRRLWLGWWESAAS